MPHLSTFNSGDREGEKKKKELKYSVNDDQPNFSKTPTRIRNTIINLPLTGQNMYKKYPLETFDFFSS